MGHLYQWDRVVSRLKLYFACLSCLGGLVLAAGTDNASIPVIAVFFAIFGYVFVDVLQLFALPPIAAYAAMAVAALYSVSDFAELDAPGNQQMEAVAQLLVLVQAILMLQKKSRRIFEQLGVFCLLELIVAAVFNNAISFGLLLVPIGVIGAWALSLLAVLSAAEGLELPAGLEPEESGGWRRHGRPASSIAVSSPESTQSLSAAALRLPRIALTTLAPAVLLVAVIFFYALPRTTDAARVTDRGTALVGFSDQLRLEQIGQMMQSTETAVRMYMTDSSTGQAYKPVGGVYLRGRVLEYYQAQFNSRRNTATWGPAPGGYLAAESRLPAEFNPTRNTDRNFFDSVKVTAICESMRSGSLFTIAPYHRIREESGILHSPDRWTLERREQEDWTYPRITYSFGTHAFRSGVQSELIARTGSEAPSAPTLPGRLAEAALRHSRAAEDSQYEEYIEELLAFDAEAMPTAEELARKFVNSRSGERQSDYEIAKEMERYFASGREYGYTLKLDAVSVPGVDPIEQFLAIDKRGHCQYFASALAMMLRSQGIPARIIAGYHTDEFNELGQHYVARQLHAHAWVEALIDRDQLSVHRNLYGQPPADEYWLRLDPTPAGGRIRESGGGVGQVLDMAQNMWDDYVVDMDASRQDNTLLGGGIAPMSGSLKTMVDWFSLKIARIRAGELGGGSLASRDLFSWPAAILGGLLSLLALTLFRVRVPAWIRGRIGRGRSQRAARPTIDFYAETLDQLARVGVRREISQTPAELATAAAEKLQGPLIPPIAAPLGLLTSAYYSLRFGAESSDQGADLETGRPIEHARVRSDEVQRALGELTHSVDMMMSQRATR
jgi:transglutaminase-like putative cysteine protease